MLIKNLDETLVNGSLGKVIGFMSYDQFDNYQESETYMATQGGGLFEPKNRRPSAHVHGSHGELPAE
jgi:hypothetical protein